MEKKEVIKMLDSYFLTKLDIDAFNSERQFYTYSVYKNEIYVHVGKDLSFCLNLKKSRTNDFFSYSAICAAGYELQMDLEKCIEILKKYLDLRISEDEIIRYLQ